VAEKLYGKFKTWPKKDLSPSPLQTKKKKKFSKLFKEDYNLMVFLLGAREK